MTEPLGEDLTMVDLLPVVDMVAEKLPEREQVDSVIKVTKLRKVRFPTSHADETQLWIAVFETALDEPTETLGLLLRNISRALGPRSKKDLEEALGKVGECCISRLLRSAHPDLGDQADVLLDATGVPEMEAAAQTLRQTALSIRRLLMRPVLGEACIKLAPSVLDPERRRMELADLAVDVVTAADYLLSLLGAPVTTSPPLLLERELGSDHGHGPSDADAFVRLTQRRLDARAIAAKRGMRPLEGLRGDVANG
jgi:hypothetical protein